MFLAARTGSPTKGSLGIRADPLSCTDFVPGPSPHNGLSLRYVTLRLCCGAGLTMLRTTRKYHTSNDCGLGLQVVPQDRIVLQGEIVSSPTIFTAHVSMEWFVT